MEDVLAELAAVPGVRAAALGGFDGLLVDVAVADAAVGDDARVPAHAVEALISGGTPVSGMLPVSGVPPVSGILRVSGAPFDLDGAVVEVTHAWHALRRACAEHLGAGAARELIVVADGGIALAHTVGDRWFALAWVAPTVDLGAARTALQRAAAGLTEAVA